MSDFFELIARRESCRSYAGTPVEEEKLLRCLDAARLAPSACNGQPWSFLAVRTPTLAAQLAACTQSAGMNRFTSACPCFVVLVEEKDSLTARAGARLKKQDFVSLDLGLAAAQFCLAATAQGLSTCMLGWFDEDRVRALLDIPGDRRVRLIICLGYAAETGAPRPKNRKPLDAVVTLR